VAASQVQCLCLNKTFAREPLSKLSSVFVSFTEPDMQTPRRHFSPSFGHGLSGNSRGAILSDLSLSGRTGRPATPFAVGLKVVTPGLLAALLWSQAWIGLSAALPLTGAAALSLAVVQKMHLGRGTGNGWMSQVGFGERIWLNRLLVPVPHSLNTGITLLYPVFWTGALVALLGGYSMSVLLTLTGLLVAHTAQFVCFQKQIRLYREMKTKAPLYRFWAALPDNDNGKSGQASV